MSVAAGLVKFARRVARGRCGAHCRLGAPAPLAAAVCIMSDPVRDSDADRCAPNDRRPAKECRYSPARRGPGHGARRPLADPARHSGCDRLRSGGRGRHRRRRAQPVARRGSWRAHLLPLVPDHPAGQHTSCTLCRAEACQAMGAARSRRTRGKTLGVDFHETTPDGSVTLEPVYCLGNCACSARRCWSTRRLHGRVTPRAFRCARRGGAQVTRQRIYVPRDATALSLGADETVAGDRARRPTQRGTPTSSSSATARAGCSGSSPSSRSRRRAGASPTGR